MHKPDADTKDDTFVAHGGEGYEVELSDAELESANFRMLASSVEPEKKTWFVPGETRVPLLFLRMIFTRLRGQLKSQEQASGIRDLFDDRLPFEAFQRAYGRLFYMLSDAEGWDAKEYDLNGDGLVSWEEFFQVYKIRNIIVKYNWQERIFLTFDSPESSHISQLISVVVLLAICLSSCCFVFATVPEWQDHPDNGDPPQTKQVFETIEKVCLYLFISEYIVRLLTCWRVRTEVCDRDYLMDAVVGYQPVRFPSAIVRFARFFFAIPNLIDLAAITPFHVMFKGSNFVVLRLIRLTRIFRAFKNPALLEPVIIIYRTVKLSTKAMYVLAFNLLLGIVIFGSLMYLAEGGGEWDEYTQSYLRRVGRQFNASGTGEWEDVKESTPFQSIPHAFWWAIVTATTVGYGDHYPTTSTGYIVATLTMLFSMVILALPVGVIGGTFSQVWIEFDREKAQNIEIQRREMIFITSAIQRLDPVRMSRLVLLEVWHDRSHTVDFLGSTKARDTPTDFMGEAKLDLNLPCFEASVTEHTLQLKANHDIVKRNITGTITVRCEWTPDCILQGKTSEDQAERDLRQAAQTDDKRTFELLGQLKVTVVSADHLINLDCSRKNGASSPYALVLTYPTSPRSQGNLRPCVWRTPTCGSSNHPRWNASHCFKFDWQRMGNQLAEEHDTNGAPLPPVEEVSKSSSMGKDMIADKSSNNENDAPCSQAPVASAKSNAGSKGSLQQVLHVLQNLSNDVTQVREEVRTLWSRVDVLAAEAGPTPAPPLPLSSDVGRYGLQPKAPPESLLPVGPPPTGMAAPPTMGLGAPAHQDSMGSEMLPNSVPRVAD